MARWYARSGWFLAGYWMTACAHVLWFNTYTSVYVFLCICVSLCMFFSVYEFVCVMYVFVFPAGYWMTACAHILPCKSKRWKKLLLDFGYWCFSVCIGICIHLCMCLCVYVYVWVCVVLCMCLRLYVFVCVYLHRYLYTCVCACVDYDRATACKTFNQPTTPCLYNCPRCL